MQIPLQIRYHNTDPDDRIDALIRDRVDRLESLFPGVISCRVAVDVPQKALARQERKQIRVDLRVPGEEIAVTREPKGDEVARSVETTVGETFDEVRRRLQDYARRMQGHEKAHAEPARARVRRLFPDEDYGFLETPGGDEIYFHRNAVVGGPFESLEPGVEVSFVEEEGEKGAQASTVRILGRHHHER